MSASISDGKTPFSISWLDGDHWRQFSSDELARVSVQSAGPVFAMLSAGPPAVLESAGNFICHDKVIKDVKQNHRTAITFKAALKALDDPGVPLWKVL